MSYISSWLCSPCGPWALLQFLNLYTVGRTPWTGDQPIARPLPTHRTTQTQNKRTQTSMPRVRFEPTIPVFQRAKTVHALGHAATVVGVMPYITFENRVRLSLMFVLNGCVWSPSRFFEERATSPQRQESTWPSARSGGNESRKSTIFAQKSVYQAIGRVCGA
jgi:hypothetical protein